MAETLRHAPMRLPVSITTGAWAIATGAIAEGTGAQTGSLTLAIVAGAFLLGAAIVTPIVNELIRRARKTPVDHRNEQAAEQVELAALRTIDHLIDQIHERDEEIARLKRRQRRA